MRTFALSLTVSLGFLLISIEAIRRRHIKEHAAILWLAVSGAMVLLSISLPLHWLDRLSRLVGIAVPSNLVLLLAVLFLVALVLQLSISVAHLTEKTTVLVQEIGILTAREPSVTDPIDGGGAGRHRDDVNGSGSEAAETPNSQTSP
jgi:hypothetical protein